MAEESKQSLTGNFLDCAMDYNVLVVDDVKSCRKIVSRLLTKTGCTCQDAVDGIDALEKVHASTGNINIPPFDFILMDYEMPNMNGPDAACKLRAEGCSIPIIGLTGNVLDDDQKYFIRQGANVVLTKPLYLPKLKETLSQILVARVL